MLKFVGVAIWSCAVTLAAGYASVTWQLGQVPSKNEEKLFGGLDYVKTDTISVPVISEGEIKGYVIAQFVFTIEAKLLKRMSVKPNAFLLDEAFKTIYAGDIINFRKIEKQDLPRLAKLIAGNVNKRFGAKFVEDVLIEQLNYVPIAEIRKRGRK